MRLQITWQERRPQGAVYVCEESTGFFVLNRKGWTVPGPLTALCIVQVTVPSRNGLLIPDLKKKKPPVVIMSRAPHSRTPWNLTPGARFPAGRPSPSLTCPGGSASLVASCISLSCISHSWEISYSDLRKSSKMQSVSCCHIQFLFRALVSLQDEVASGQPPWHVFWHHYPAWAPSLRCKIQVDLTHLTKLSFCNRTRFHCVSGQLVISFLHPCVCKVQNALNVTSISFWGRIKIRK